MMARPERPPAWAVLEQALLERRPVRARYHGTDRVLCPHALGWKNARPKVLSYQAGPAGLPAEPRQRWRSMFVDEIEDPVITDARWETADNYSPATNGIDDLEISVGMYVGGSLHTGNPT